MCGLQRIPCEAKLLFNELLKDGCCKVFRTEALCITTASLSYRILLFPAYCKTFKNAVANQAASAQVTCVSSKSEDRHNLLTAKIYMVANKMTKLRSVPGQASA